MRKSSARANSIVWSLSLLVLTHACSNESSRNNPKQPDTASIQFAQTAPDFSGNSIRICGARYEAANALFPCESVLLPSTSGLSVPSDDIISPPTPIPATCPCFDFTSSGSLVDPITGDPVVINGLCPSNSPPESDWFFLYTIYTEASCNGDVLNEDPNNFTCYDVHDLATQSNPNATSEPLAPGLSSNQIFCISEGADKAWGFVSTTITSTPEENELGLLRFNPGCEPANFQCSCFGLSADNLPTGCLFDPQTCEVLCSPSPTFFPCVDQVFASSYIQNTNTTELLIMDPESHVISRVSSTDQYAYDAIGFNPLDGFIYGISNTNAVGDPRPRLLRLDRFGNVTDLGTLPGLEGDEWIVGDFFADGTYLIGAFNSSRWLRIDVAMLQVIDSGTFTPVARTPLATAVHPTSGLFWGYQGWTNNLSTFDPATNMFTLGPSLPGVPTTPCSAAFLRSGTMLLYCWATIPFNGVNILYEIDVESATATFITDDEIPLGIGDMASCVFDSP